MTELNNVMKEQVRIMEQEKDKLEREVRSAKGTLEEKSSEKRVLMTALENVHAETQNQEYGLLRSAIQNSLYLKSKPGLIPGIPDPAMQPASVGSFLGFDEDTKRTGQFEFRKEVAGSLPRTR